jgi:hypothetical protein
MDERSVHMALRLSLLAALAVAVALASAVHGDERHREQGHARPPAQSERQQLQRSLALWERQHVRNYRFRLRVSCFCLSARHAVTVTVRDARPVGTTESRRRFGTVPKLFEVIRRAIDDPAAGAVVVRYDSQRGFPRTASIDPVARAIDDEFGWTVDRFRAVRAG